MVHGSRGGWDRRVAAVRRVGFRMDFRYVGWDRSVFSRHGIGIDRSVSVKFKFQVGLTVGVRWGMDAALEAVM